MFLQVEALADGLEFGQGHENGQAIVRLHDEFSFILNSVEQFTAERLAHFLAERGISSLWTFGMGMISSTFGSTTMPLP
jgi:hypothetical protein